MPRNHKLCLVLVGGEKPAEVKPALRQVGWVELRVDLFLRRFPEEAVSGWVRGIRGLDRAVRIIGTVRWPRESQVRTGKGLGDTARLALYRQLLPLVDWVDVETKSKIAPVVISVAHEQDRNVILSWHNFDKTPSFPVLSGLYRSAGRIGADIVKFACKTATPDQLVALLWFTRRYSGKTPLVVTPMGAGPLERLMPLSFGSLFTYVSLRESTAPGQLSLGRAASLLVQ